MLSTDIIQNCH